MSARTFALSHYFLPSISLRETLITRSSFPKFRARRKDGGNWFSRFEQEGKGLALRQRMGWTTRRIDASGGAGAGRRAGHYEGFFRSFSTSSATTSSSTSSQPESLTQRLRLLLRQHGSTALTIYIILSTLDFSLTFAFIWFVGADKVEVGVEWIRGVWKGVVEKFKGIDEGSSPPTTTPAAAANESSSTSPLSANSVTSTTPAPTTPGGAGGGNAQSLLWTTLILTYTIHKTIMLPFRVGVTAAVTPKVVRMLKERGWRVGSGKKALDGKGSGEGESVKSKAAALMTIGLLGSGSELEVVRPAKTLRIEGEGTEICREKLKGDNTDAGPFY